jgi:hypothetical protein
MQSKRFTNEHSKPAGVGLALVAMPQISFEKRHAGERRPYI